MGMLTEILAQLSNSAAQQNELMRQFVLHSTDDADDREDTHEGHSSGTAKGGPAGTKKKFPKKNKAILEMLHSSLSHGQHSDEYPPFGAHLTGVDLYNSIITDVAERHFNCNVTHFMARAIVNVEFGAQRTKYMDDTKSWDDRGPRIGDFRNLTSWQREQYVHVDHSIEGVKKSQWQEKAETQADCTSI